MKTANFAACVLICLRNRAENGQNSPFVSVPDVEEEQTLALALALRERVRVKPTLVCLKNSWLHACALEMRLPVLTVGGSWAGNPLLLLRLWNWQRRNETLLIQTVGVESLDLGYRMLRMRREGGAVLVHAFFLRPPPPEICGSKMLCSAHGILCGSEYVRRHIVKAWEKTVRNAPDRRFFKDRAAPADEDKLVLLSPGIDVNAYTQAPEWEEGRHFVFGMGSSLTPRSGARSAVRAMTAIWQRDDAPLWEVRMAGAGPLYAEILEEATNLGVASRLCLLNDQYMPDVLEGCHAWLAPGPAFDERPDALWAGFASFLPVICSRSGLHLERLRGHEDAALMLEDNNPQALAHAMLNIMLDARLRDRLVSRAGALRERAGFERMTAQACSLFTVFFQRYIGKQMP
ncbi:MAG: glycosyltransferase [Desulfovibrio sp.]|jgi:glycosyltransferase involved in cell wall biosynthesis|nr:glycosyltransferase [Desulfovibrio sp.]